MNNLYSKISAITFFIVIVTGIVLAQSTNTNSAEVTLSPDDVYTVVTGDRLAALSPDRWKELKEFNPYLNEPGRTETGPNGWVKVLIYPGEQLKGLKQLGITMMGQAGAQTSATPTPNPSKSPQDTSEKKDQEAGLLATITEWMPWILLLLAAASLALLGYIIWFLLNRRNAANDGPRFVDGGVSDRTVTNAFLTQARAHYGDGNRPINSFQILRQQRRRASGTILVEYKDGRSRSHTLNNDVIYIADIQYPDGSIRRDQMMLQACGNPLRPSGNVAAYVPGLNFRFTDEQATVVPVQTEPIEQTQQPQPATAIQTNTNEGVFFTKNNKFVLVAVSGGKVEMAKGNDVTFSLEQNGDEKIITVRKNGSMIKFQNGKIVDFGVEQLQLPASSEEIPATDNGNSAAAANA